MSFEELNMKDYEITTSYPVITTEKDSGIVPDLIEAYAGNSGEFTASTQYIYQSFIVKPNAIYKGLYAILERISIKEMHHLEILSQLLLAQGINPKFCRYIDQNLSLCNPWSTNQIKYNTNVKEFLNDNILLEEKAIAEYMQIIEKSTSNNIKEVIARIIEDEKAHLKIFHKLLEILQNSEKEKKRENEKEKEKEKIN